MSMYFVHFAPVLKLRRGYLCLETHQKGIDVLRAVWNQT